MPAISSISWVQTLGLSPEKKKNTVFLLRGNICPWGREEAQLNPILCTISRGIFARILDIYEQDLEVEVLETMGNGDEQCLFQLNKIEY